MAEYVTRQFADKTTGAPIIGGDYRLANVADVGADTVAFIECTDPLYPGRYTSEDPVPMGVYSVERNEGAGFLPTGEEISVAPGRTAVGALGGADGRTVLDIVIGDVVHATAFVPEAATSPTTAHLQAAILYAEGNGLKKVYVGAFKGVSNWAGGQVVIAEPNMEIDLGGAKVMRTDATGSVFDVQADAGGGDGNFVHFRNGDIVGFTGLTPESNDYAEINSTCRVLCSHVRFPRWPGGAARGIAATVQNGAGYVQAHFHECLGHVLWGDTDRAHARIQTSNTTCLQTSGVASPLGFYPAGLANVPESELGAMFGELMAGATTTAPSDAAAPFGTGADAGRALKHLFFEEKPKLDALAAAYEACDRQIAMTASIFSVSMVGVYSAGNGNNPFYDGFSVRASSANAGVASGIEMRRIKKVDDTLFSRVEGVAFFHLASGYFTQALPGQPGVYPGVMLWAPKAMTVDLAAAQGLIEDVDGQAIIGIDGSARLMVRQYVAGNDPLYTNTRVFHGRASLNGTTIEIEFLTGFDAISLGDSAYLDDQDRSNPFWLPSNRTAESGVGRDEFPACFCELSFVSTNKTRTDLPRFL